MKLSEILTVLLSSTVISTAFTALLNLFFNRKKDTLENITKERKVWRNELRLVAEDIAKAEDYDELSVSINKLKVRINAYGIASDLIFLDSHIWKLINELELTQTLTTEELKNYKRTFVNQISCLLKYDWDRSKVEIKGNIQTRIVISSLIFSFILYSVKWFMNYSTNSGIIMDYFKYCVIYSLFAIFSMFVIVFADKWRYRFERNIFFAFAIGVFILLCVLAYYVSPNLMPLTIVDTIIILLPVVTLIYSTEIKILNYMRNVKRFIVASAISNGKLVISKKYHAFFHKLELNKWLALQEALNSEQDKA